MSLKQLAIRLGGLCASLGLVLTVRSAVVGQCCEGGCGAAGGCREGGCRGPCPPPYIHHQEGPPRIRFRHACPRPVCPPCDTPNWGYFQTCWRPWPWPPDWSHCPAPPLGALLGQPLPLAGPPSDDRD